MGLNFMQEMLDLTKMQALNQLAQMQVVAFPNITLNITRVANSTIDYDQWTTLVAGPSHFSPELVGDEYVESEVVFASPFRGCDTFKNTEDIRGKILLMERGDCTFVHKARQAQIAGAIAVIVCDNVPGSSGETQPMFAMSGDGINDVKIPVVFMFSQESFKLFAALSSNPNLTVQIMQMIEFKRRLLQKTQSTSSTLALSQKTNDEL